MEKFSKKLRRFVASAAVLALCGAMLSASAAYRPECLVPVGRTAGIKLFAGGVAVRSVEEVETETGKASPARDGGVRAGDLILAVNGKDVEVIPELTGELNACGGECVRLTVLREGREIFLDVTPAKCTDGSWRIGASVRDSMAGIGTLTFYDPEAEVFGALGHGIAENDSYGLFPVAKGCLVPSAVTGVKKGVAGVPGELIGQFRADEDCGSVTANTGCGLFGTLSPGELCPEALSGAAVPVGYGEIQTGKATILSNISMGEVREFSVEIVKIVSKDRTTKNFRIRITDPVLLEATGGIVQGMSGSPVIQNGRLVGAVTHVCVNEPTEGYGIFIENMLSACDVAVRDAVA